MQQTSFDPKNQLEQAINQHPLMMPPHILVVEAIATMSQAKSSCILIVEQQKLRGIFTERDLVTIIASKISLEAVTLAEVMTQDLITLSSHQKEDIFSVLSLMRSSQIRYLPVIDEQRNVLGIISQSTLLSALDGLELKTQEVRQANIQLQQEITEGKLAEAALRESQEHYREVFEKSVDGIVFTDFEGKILNCNASYQKMLGYSLEELQQKRFQDVTPDKWHLMEAEIAEQQILVRGYSDTYEKEYIHKDGTVFPVELSAYCQKNQTEQPEMIWAIVRDISNRKQAEQALRESEQLYLAIIEDQTELIIRFVQDGTVTFVNEAYCRYFGLTRKEIIGHRFEPLIVEEDREQVNRLLNSINLENPVITIENRVIVADEVRWTQWIDRGIFDEQGGVIQLQAVGRDITEQKQIELALQSSQAKLNNILNNTNASIASFRLFPDKTWKYEYWSQGCERMFGYTAEEFMAEPTLWFSHVFPEDVEQGRVVNVQNFMLDYPTITQGEYRFFHKDGSLRWSSFQASSRPDQSSGWIVTVLDVDITDKKRAEFALRQSIEREKAIATVIQRMRQTLDIESIFRATTEELRGVMECDRVVVYRFNSDWSGEFMAESVASGWVSLMQQPTNKQKADEQLLNHPSCTVKTTMLKDIPEFIVDTYLQETQGGIYNQSINYRVTQDIYQAEFTQCYLELLERFQVRAYIIVPIYCGSQLWGLLATYQNSHPRTWSESEISTVVQIGLQLGVALQQAQLLEATAQQAVQLEHAAYTAVNAAAQSAAANRAKSQFLANMSHELRTPLNGILGYAQILQADKDCTPNQKKGVAIIHKCGTHLLTLINDILDLSKIEAGKLELYPEDFYLPSFLTNLSEIFQLKATQKSISFTYLPFNQLPKLIHADEKRLRQVLMNLLSNAVKFTDRGSVTFKVEVIGSKEDLTPLPCMIRGELDSPPLLGEEFLANNQQLITTNKIRFQIEDTGIGIPHEQLEKIFLPFEQVGDISRRAEGTGLGLAITKKILELMGSQLFVESTPEVGSKFWFDVDLLEISTSINSTTLKLTDKIIGYAGEKRKILIVDDRWENRTVLSNMLEPIGFELEEAVDGEDGLEKAVEFLPDLILVDLVMPVIDGYQMTQRLRQLSEFQQTPLIAVSANAFAVDQQKSKDAGCNDFLAKPIQSQDLFDKIKSYLNLSWVYENESETETQKSGAESRYITQTEMTLPPKEELFVLYEAVSCGAVGTVEEEVTRLGQLSSEYADFVTRIQELAEDFEYEKIKALIDKLLP